MSEQCKSGSAGPGRSKAVVERTYRARVEDLWRLWTTLEGFESWWGPVGFRAEVHTLEARAGGILYYDLIAEAPEQIAAMKQMGRPTSHAGRARFTGFEPLERVAITSLIDFIPGVTPYENTMTVDFVPSGESARMVVTLDPMHDEELTKLSALGFASQLTKLDQQFGWQESRAGRR